METLKKWFTRAWATLPLVIGAVLFVVFRKSPKQSNPVQEPPEDPKVEEKIAELEKCSEVIETGKEEVESLLKPTPPKKESALTDAEGNLEDNIARWNK
jgi:hypothetical protein